MVWGKGENLKIVSDEKENFWDWIPRPPDFEPYWHRWRKTPIPIYTDFESITIDQTHVYGIVYMYVVMYIYALQESHVLHYDYSILFYSIVITSLVNILYDYMKSIFWEQLQDWCCFWLSGITNSADTHHA